MKVLITVATYYPKKDGVAMVTKYMAEGLVKKGHSVKVITTNKGEKEDYEIHNGVEICRVNLYTKYGFYFGNKKEYKKLIDEEASKCDAMINVCTQNAFTDVIINRVVKYKCKKILYLHGIFDFKFHKIDFTSFASIANKLWKEIRWFFYYSFNTKKFKRYDVVTQLHEKDYATRFFKKKYNINSVIIENAADDEFFERKTVSEFKKPFDKYFIYVANYMDSKNQKLAIREFLKSNIKNDIGLVLIGSDKNKYYDKLQKEIIKCRKKYNLSENEKPILLLYNVARDSVIEYVKNAYAYLMTSKSEKFPMAVVESMASGVPFISTDVGIVRYLFGGIVVRKNKDIHYYIEELCNNTEIRNDLAVVVKQYALDNMQITDKIADLEKIIM